MVTESRLPRRQYVLRFRTRVLLLPIVAALSFALVLVVTQYLGHQNGSVLSRIRSGYVPSLLLSRDLRFAMERVERTLQDAVAAEDTDALARADAIAKQLDGDIARALQNQTEGREEVAAFSAEFREHYQLARATSERLIERKTGSDLGEILGRVAKSSASLRSRLDEAIERDHRRANEAFAEAARLQGRAQWLSAAIVVACLLLLLALAVWTAKSVIAPLQFLTGIAHRIAESGDVREDVPDLGDDEIGVLARSFQSVVVRLRSIPASLGASAEELKTALSSLTEVSAKQSSSLLEQVAALGQAAAGTDGLRRTSASAASEAKRVLDVARRATEVGAAGQDSVERSLRGLSEIRDEIQAIVEQIALVEERTRRIGEVLDNVKDVADQSDMLALNAAIVAMKAGESGRQFSVVAREMRALADRCVRSTAQTRDLLQGAQTAISGAVTITARGARRMEANIADIRTSGENLRAVAAFVGESSIAAREIAAAVSTQAASVEQISAVVIDLNRRSEATKEGLRGFEAALSDIAVTSTAVVKVVESFQV
jgi:methyl-accepting chemotaxis protein